MPLPPHFLDGQQPEAHGIGLNLIPGDPPTFQVELQRAPDSGGSPGTWATIAQLPPVSAAMVYIDLLPADNTYRHYRWRHVGPGYDPSPSWSVVVKAKPVRLEGAAAKGGLISFYPIRRDKPMTDGKYALMSSAATGLMADSNVKLDPANGIFEGSVTYKLYRHREEITVNGPVSDPGEVGITFAQGYQNAPMLVVRGGQYVTYSSALGNVMQRLRLQALNVTASGFTSRAQIVNTGATTARTADFPNGNLIDAVGETAEADLGANAPANDNTYNVHYYVEVTLSSPGVDPSVTLTVAIESNDGGGGGWIERATFVYSRSSAGTSTWNEEIKPIIVSGLGANDDIRLRAKAFVVHDATGSFKVQGGDAGGSAPGSFNGVTWTTATDDADTAIPNAGDHVVWVAQEVA
jgi:hypothetical protein